MNKWLFSIWKFSWLITIPITIIFLYWLAVTVQHYMTFAVRYNSRPVKITLLETGSQQFKYMLREFSHLFTPSNKHLLNAQPLDRISLFVNESDISKLNKNLPHSGMSYVSGRLLNGGNIEKIKVRYRGDTVIHWYEQKKSLRVKTSKKKLYKGLRKFNLIVPKVQFKILNHMSYKLAHELGLIAPKSDVVDVIINGKPRGVYIFVEQLDESTLRQNKKMPGDIYSGELVLKDNYIGASQFVFEHPGLWEKAAVNNHFPENSRKPLERLIKLINSKPSDSVSRELNELLDMEAWGRFSAFETLAQTSHFDHAHNWRLYYDPAKEKFVPIVWDPVGWFFSPSSSDLPIKYDISSTRLHKALFNEREFILAKHKVIKQFFESGTDRSFLHEFDNLTKRITTSIYADPSFISPEQILTDISKLRKRIENVFEQVASEFIYTQNPVQYTNENNMPIQISMTGRQPIEQITLLFQHQFEELISVKIAYWVNEKKIEKDVSGAVTVDGNKLLLNVPLVSNYTSAERTGVSSSLQKVSDAYYEIYLSDVTSDNLLLEVAISRSGKIIEPASKVEDIKKISFKDSYNVINEQPRNTIDIWKGNINIKGIKHVYTDVQIEPGTTVRLEAAASVIFHGRVIGKGIPEHPVRFLPASQEQEPWGSIVLKGKGSDGSRLNHCLFLGGSGYKGDLFEYSAMFSIHDVKGVKVGNCRFLDSKIVDDMVHAVYSEVTFSNSEFVRSLSDALDLDISKVLIKNCKFVDSGNDAIDLMTTDATVINSSMVNSGDKGISVGEGSRLLAINSLISNNAIGVQSKDSSVAVIYNIDLTGNAYALDAYKKNWRYDSGGYIYAYKSRLLENEQMISADKNSSIRLYDSSYDKSVNIDRNKSSRIKLNKSSIGVGSEASEKKLWRYPTEIKKMRDFDSHFWSLINVYKRGRSKATSED